MTLSIITINYNNRDGLQRTIDSVICQTWKDHEWIVIDGGSTDGSKELIEQYQDHFAYWCSEPDRGIYHAMNKGIDKAKGLYLLFLNSGDSLHEDSALKKVIESGVKTDIISGISVNQETGRAMKNYHPDIVRQLFFDTLNHQATFIKRELFDKYKYNEENKIVSDWEFFVQAILIDGCSISYLDEIIVDFDAHGISNRPELKSLQLSERKRVIEKYFTPYIRKDILRLFEICDSPIYKNLQYLKEHYRLLYILIRKMNSCVIKIRGNHYPNV